MAEINNAYPVAVSIDYPAKAGRLTTFFRLFTVIPILIILVLLGGVQYGPLDQNYYAVGVGLLVAPTLLMILFRKKYPGWWFDWNLSLTRFSTRVLSYLLLLTHEYPSTDEDQAVHIEIAYPEAEKELHRAMPLVKWFLVIPHLIVLCILYIAVTVCTIIAWFAILFAGVYPRGMFDFVVGVIRWTIRMGAYSILLTTDRYPPFSLN